MAINARAKGARGERELAKYLTGLGFDCERSARNGVKGATDVIWKRCPTVIIECKMCDTYRPGRKELDKVIERLRGESDDWMLFVKESRQPWKMYFETFYDGLLVMIWGDDRIKHVLTRWEVKIF